MSNFRVDDESGDRKYFTMVPNYVLNHSGVVEQGLYLQMKRFAGEHGSCFASGRTLRKKLGIGLKAYNKAIKYLLVHEWIYYKGKQMVNTAGGAQMVPIYGVKDLWKLNNDFYADKGVAKSKHPPKVYPKGIKGVDRSNKGVAESEPKKIHEEELYKKDSSFKKLDEEMRKRFPSKR